VARVQRHGPEVHVDGGGPLLAFVGAHLVDIGRPALDLRVHRPSLEDQFVKLIHSQRSPATQAVAGRSLVGARSLAPEEAPK
jgi:hypothetical protein